MSPLRATPDRFATSSPPASRSARSAGEATVALSVLVISALADVHVGLPIGTALWSPRRSTSRAFFAVAGTLLWRDRAVLRMQRVALWIEEHDPSLEYRLVTAVESEREAMVPLSGTSEWSSTAFARSSRAVVPALAAMLVAFVVPSFVPASSLGRLIAPHRGDALDRPPRRGSGDQATHATGRTDRTPGVFRSSARRRSMIRPTSARSSAARSRCEGAAMRPASSLKVDAITTPAVARRRSLVDHLQSRQRNPRHCVSHDGRERAHHRCRADRGQPPRRSTLAAPVHDSVLRAPHGRIPLTADVERRLRDRDGLVRVHRQLRRRRDVHVQIRHARRGGDRREARVASIIVVARLARPQTRRHRPPASRRARRKR